MGFGLSMRHLWFPGRIVRTRNIGGWVAGVKRRKLDARSLDATVIKGFEGNERDGQYRSIRNRDPRGHETLCVDFAPVKDSRIGELAARWDIILGYSPEA